MSTSTGPGSGFGSGSGIGDVGVEIRSAAAMLARSAVLDRASADALCERALGGDAASLNHLAMAVREGGDPPAAVRLLEHLVRTRPGYAPAWSNLGGLRREAGDVAGAVAAFERNLELEPGSANGLYNLGALLHAANRPEQACEHLAKLTVVAPRDAGAWNLLGLAQCDANATEAGIASLTRARELAPNAPDVANNLGVALGYAGRFDAARGEFERALTLAPEFGLAWENLVRNRRLGVADHGLVERLAERLHRGTRNPFDRICLHYALGKAYDDLGRPDEAFVQFREANTGMAARAPYDAPAHDALVDRIIERCDQGLVARCRALASADARAVFVFGMPRSGTTLVERILGRSAGVHTAGEMPVVDAAIARLSTRAGAPFPEALVPAPGRDAMLAAMAAEVSEGIGRVAPAATRIVDKMPGNYLYLGLLHALLPRATFVHCRRDPRDTGLSLYFTRFAVGHAFSYSLDHIASRIRAYQRVMEHWRSLMGPRLVEVDYDLLVREPEPTTRRLLADVGLDWSDGALDPARGGSIRTASSWQARQPISRGSSGRWQHYEAYLGPLRDLCR